MTRLEFRPSAARRIGVPLVSGLAGVVALGVAVLLAGPRPDGSSRTGTVVASTIVALLLIAEASYYGSTGRRRVVVLPTELRLCGIRSWRTLTWGAIDRVIVNVWYGKSWHPVPLSVSVYEHGGAELAHFRIRIQPSRIDELVGVLNKHVNSSAAPITGPYGSLHTRRARRRLPPKSNARPRP